MRSVLVEIAISQESEFSVRSVSAIHRDFLHVKGGGEIIDSSLWIQIITFHDFWIGL